jgi:hypothetical protein
MALLRVSRGEFTYQIFLSPPQGSIIDTPGKIASALASQLGHIGLELPDIAIDEGTLEERGLSFDLEEPAANVLLRADRIEFRFSSLSLSDEETSIEVVRSTLQALFGNSPSFGTQSHSLQFELDGIPIGQSYSEIMGDYCRPHSSLPPGTETAVVYYLPADPDGGLLESNLVLNRSGDLAGGLTVAATIVFSGELSAERAIPAGRSKLEEILNGLNLELNSE